MKRIICLLLVSITLCIGCQSKQKNIPNSKNENEKPQLSCKIQNDILLYCNNELYNFNEYGDLLMPTEWNYNYNENGLLDTITLESGKILLTYNVDKSISTIKYMVDNEGTAFTYKFLYKDNKIQRIEKDYSYSEFSDSIVYEYYTIDKIDYVKETVNSSDKIYIRTFKFENMTIPTNVFELLNYLPSFYYQKIQYIPFYNLINVNTNLSQSLSPIFVTKVESYIEQRKGSNSTPKQNITYYFDEKGRYITDSNKTIIHKFEENNDNQFM